ncbi:MULTISPECIES: thermonuclease family protein [unclassified Nitratireductor]|uniref:thermonuclease family protein n=1 Tax=unclassified Nitratireductor TaxID=2641084 RepID=UPI0025E8FC84|nr:thermonuclease family protein [Nitratireductor sp.]
MRGRRNRRSRGRRSIRIVDVVLTLLFLGGVALLVDRLQRFGGQTLTGVVIVHDGDTLTVAGERIRLEGIDAPEFQQRCTLGGKEYACGREALRALRRLVGGAEVVCEGFQRDRYDRLLARCKVNETDIGEALVAAGWALAYGDYDAVEAEARRAQRGIWGGGFEAPRDWREEHHGEPRPGDGDLLRRLWGRLVRWFSGEE